MLFELEQGQISETIIKQVRSLGLPLPDKIANAPRLLLGLDFYYNAFLKLSSCRSIGMSEGRIPWTAIKEYGYHHGLDDDDVERLVYLVNAMDAEYLKYRAKESKAETEKSKAKTPIGGSRAPRPTRRK